MSDEHGTRVIYGRTPELAAVLANVKRAMAITAKLNRSTFDDADEIRALFDELIGKKVDESFLLIPPFYTAGGDEIRVGHNVFVNQNCTFYDLGGLDIAARHGDHLRRVLHDGRRIVGIAALTRSPYLNYGTAIIPDPNGGRVASRRHTC